MKIITKTIPTAISMFGLVFVDGFLSLCRSLSKMVSGIRNMKATRRDSNIPIGL